MNADDFLYTVGWIVLAVAVAAAFTAVANAVVILVRARELLRGAGDDE